MTIIEELTVTLDPSRIDAFLERDAAVWTPYLESRDGFLSKETWRPDDRSDTVIFIIRWASVMQWKSITEAEVAAVDQQMGDLRPDTIECRSHRVVD